MNKNEAFQKIWSKTRMFYSSSSMSISLSDSQNPSEERDKDSKDSFEPSLAVLKSKMLCGFNYDVTKY